MRTVAGLEHTIGDTDQAHLENIAQMTSSDPARAAAARLNRDLINIMEQFLHDQGDARALTVDTMIAVMHGVVTVCGTILINVPEEKRIEMHATMREMLLKPFDAMGEAVRQHNSEPMDCQK